MTSTAPRRRAWPAISNVVGPDRCSGTFERRANVAGFLGILCVKGHDRDGQLQEHGKSLDVVIAPCAFGNAETHFKQHDHRQCNNIVQEFAFEPFGHFGRIALQHGNDCVGTQQEHQSSETSSWGGIGGCCLPSSMNGMS